MSDKPIHVQVAEALGWTTFAQDYHSGFGRPPKGTMLTPPGGEAPMMAVYARIPRYDTDWSATGPLVEKYNISLLHDITTSSSWQALLNARDDIQFTYDMDAGGLTPLLAICRLIIALGKAGKL